MDRMFDAHCHIDVSAAWAPPGDDSPASGRLLCGVDPGDWNRVAEAAAAWPGTVPAFGLHPWHAWRADGSWRDRLEEFLAAHPDAWLGEAGLDGIRTGDSPFSAQEEALAWQLGLAKRLNRRVNLHCVKAWEPLAALLDSQYLSDGPRDFIVHAFGGPHQYIGILAERGAYFTVGPLTTRHDSRRARARAALIPEDRLLVESDAFLVPGRDAGGELAAAAAWLAAARLTDADTLSRRIAANSRRILDHE